MQFIEESLRSGVEKTGKGDNSIKSVLAYQLSSGIYRMEGNAFNLTVLLDAPRSHTVDNFLIRDLPGTSGRLDVVCRTLIAAYRTVPIFTSHIQFLSVLGGPPNPPLLLRVSNMDFANIPESELACALILKGLLHYHRTQKKLQHPIWPQYSITQQGVKETLQEISKKKAQLFYLVETGPSLETIQPDLTKPICLILGDDKGLPSDHESLLSQYKPQHVSLGTRSLLGSQAITLFLLELARRSQ